MTVPGRGLLTPATFNARKGSRGTNFSWAFSQRASRAGPEAQFPAKPGPGVHPMPVRAAGGDPEGRGRLVSGQPGEVAQLDQLGLVRVVLRQAAQRRVEGQQVHARLRGGDRFGVIVLALPPPAVLEGRLAAGVVD